MTEHISTPAEQALLQAFQARGYRALILNGTTVQLITPNGTQHIDAGIGTSNRGIAEAALIVVALRADIGNILAAMPDIAKHANSIDCSSGLSVLSLLAGPGQACNQ